MQMILDYQLRCTNFQAGKQQKLSESFVSNNNYKRTQWQHACEFHAWEISHGNKFLWDWAFNMAAVCCCITNSIKALNSSQSTAPKLKIILHAYAQTYARTDGDTGQKDNATNAHHMGHWRHNNRNCILHWPGSIISRTPVVFSIRSHVKPTVLSRSQWHMQTVVSPQFSSTKYIEYSVFLDSRLTDASTSPLLTTVASSTRILIPSLSCFSSSLQIMQQWKCYYKIWLFGITQ